MCYDRVMDTNFVVYALFNLTFPDRLRYVGLSSKGPEQRFRGHRKAARAGVKTPVYHWLRKHGPENIGIVVLETFQTREEMRDGEIKWILYYRGMGQADLNVTDGGEGTSGYRHTDEYKARRREYMLENKIEYTITQEHRDAVSRATRERLASPEARREHANKTGKLKESIVVRIKADIWGGMSDKDAAEKYGVTFQNINKIRMGHTWGFAAWPIGPWRPVELPPTARGSERTVSKIDESDVVSIRRLVRDLPYVEVGRQFGVSAATVNNIVRGKAWTHVPFEAEYPCITDDRDLSIQRKAVSGAANKNSTLDEGEVRYIRKRHAEGASFAALARELRVSETTVANVVKRKTWKHIE